MKNIYYKTGNRIGIFRGDKPQSFESDYIERYLKNSRDIIQKNQWKNSGYSAMFQGRDESDDVLTGCEINSVTGFKEESCIYSVNCEGVSALIEKNMLTGEENSLLHSNTLVFFDTATDGTDKVIASASSDKSYLVKDIAVFDIAGNDIGTITSGDSVDSFPVQSKFDDTIFFSSRGIARGHDMQPIALSESSVLALNPLTGVIDEVMSAPNTDFIMPKTDSAKNLYYIKKPYKNAASAQSPIMDIILMPFRLVAAIVKLLVFLSKIGTSSDKRSTTRTYGANPAVQNEMSQRELYIFEHRLDTEKQQRQNARRGDKTPGFAPPSFELYRHSPGGTAEKLRSGVLSYDVDSEGNIVYTNGKYAFYIDTNGQETVLFKESLITEISF